MPNITTKNIVPTVIGAVLSLALLYVTVRVASKGWSAGQKA